MSKKIFIYYNYNGLDITFAFEEGFHGPIEGPEGSALRCYVLNDDKEVTIVYLTETFGTRELLRLVLPK
jgi:hypothetical protein